MVRSFLMVCTAGRTEASAPTGACVRIASRDRSFYGAQGGVTLSVGEPCVQSTFALEHL